jgi:hypothetical protein
LAPGVTISSSMSKREFQNVEDVIADRYKFIDQLGSGSGQQPTRAQQFKNQWDYDGGLNGTKANRLKQTWVQSGMEMWWKIHDLGLKKLYDAVPDHLRDVASTYRTKTKELETAHEQYTGRRPFLRPEGGSDDTHLRHGKGVRPLAPPDGAIGLDREWLVRRHAVDEPFADAG